MIQPEQSSSSDQQPRRRTLTKQALDGGERRDHHSTVNMAAMSSGLLLLMSSLLAGMPPAAVAVTTATAAYDEMTLMPLVRDVHEKRVHDHETKGTPGAIPPRPKSDSSSSNTRIIGGVIAGENEFPSFARGPSCGANLIWKDVVMSAAHCEGSFFGLVQVGAWEAGDNANGAQDLPILSKMVPHPAYDWDTVAWDMMMFKVGPAPDGSWIQPSPINRDQTNPSNKEPLTVIGFGTTSEFGSTSSFLRKVDVPYVNHHRCNSLYSNEIDQDSMFCAGDVVNGGIDSCQGDSGGPVFDENGTQVGIVSWGRGCARPGFPGVYARVSGDLNWVDHTICELTSFRDDRIDCTGIPEWTEGSPSDFGCNDTAPCSFPGIDYRGCVSTTVTGLTCQRWDDQSPHTHRFSSTANPGYGLADNNYCRNPDEDPAGPWCYTTDPLVRWEYCNVPEPCSGTSGGGPTDQTTRPPTPAPAPTVNECREDEDTSCTPPFFTDYRGCEAVTVTGKSCQSWASQSPHAHDFTPENFPSAGLADGSYCRNPDADPAGPWCYTTASGARWEYCNVALCNDEPPTPPGPVCADRGDPCTDSTDCCRNNDSCVDSVFGRTCQQCAGKNQLCSATEECCRGGKGFKCDGGSGTCLMCARKNRKCSTPSDCCNPLAKCSMGRRRQRERKLGASKVRKKSAVGSMGTIRHLAKMKKNMGGRAMEMKCTL